MPVRRTDLILLRNKAICERFRRYTSVREHGKQKHNTEWILEEMSLKQFYLTPETLWIIIRDEPSGGYVATENTSQLNMFEDEKTTH